MEAQGWKLNMMLGGGGNVPSDAVVMATCIIGTAPVMFIFLYLQKYIVRGITVGSVKG